ncbi:MAG: glycosyltransferase family 4 protein [Chitinophagaceae bacterium]
MPSEKKHKLLIVCPHPENTVPGQRLKYEQYFSYFREQGIEVTVRPFMTERFQAIVYQKGRVPEKIAWTLWGYLKRFLLLFSLRRYDAIYVFLWVTPFGPPFFERLYSSFSKKMIYDIDDLVYLAEAKSKVNGMVAFLKGRKKPIYLMKKANHVITCTPYLDQFVRQFNQHTTDISSTINTARYRPKSGYAILNRKLVLGWSGSHSTSKYVRLLEPVFRRLQQEGLSFRVIVMGDESFALEGIDIEAIPWKDAHEVEVIERFDIGLYPLPDEPWVYGKSGLKALQYMAIGIPTIAAAIGTNFRIIRNDETGFLVSNDQEWVDRILQLASSEELRSRIGTAAAREVEKEYSINANKDKYLSIALNVMNGKS